MKFFTLRYFNTLKGNLLNKLQFIWNPLNSMIIFDDVLSLIKLNVQNMVVNYCTKGYNK